MPYLVLCVTLNLLFFINSAYSAVYISAIYDNSDSNTVHFVVRQPFELSCNVSTDKVDKVVVKWEKDGTLIEKTKRFGGRSKTSNKDTIHKLRIHNTVDEDAGNYSCILYQSGERTATARIAVASKIAVKVPSNINVVEGEKLRILCHVLGNPHPTLYWYYQNDTYNDTYFESKGRVILEKDTEKGIPNSILKIEEIAMYDRGTFTCIAKSTINDDAVRADTMIRVKDQYAALWPFLGICAEVFILCTIIFIYEKKRNKTELEESDTDQSPDQKNTSDNGKEPNLRHRK